MLAAPSRCCYAHLAHVAAAQSMTINIEHATSTLSHPLVNSAGFRPLDSALRYRQKVFACYEMWDKLEERSCLATPVVVYAVYKSLGDVWNKVVYYCNCCCMASVIHLS